MYKDSRSAEGDLRRLSQRGKEIAGELHGSVHGVKAAHVIGNEKIGSVYKRYVSFYFTNFPAQLSLFYLRKGFEVCGILEDVYVAKNRNLRGQPYGFVKFSNVRDVTKLLKALNAVYFGHFRIRARVARFDRTTMPRAEKEKEEGKKGVEGPAPAIGDPKLAATEIRTGAKDLAVGVCLNGQSGEGVPVVPERLRVGSVMVSIGDRPAKAGSAGAQKPGSKKDNFKVDVAAGHELDNSVYLRTYKSTPEDLEWAQNGVVAVISNGEAVPGVRNRIADAGFRELDIRHLGADKVLVRNLVGLDVASIFDGAKEFFKLIFASWTRWEKEGIL
jgi:hypothetical protein